MASFNNSSAQFLKPAWGSNFSKLSVVVSSFWSTYPQILSHGQDRTYGAQGLPSPGSLENFSTPWKVVLDIA